MKKALPIVIALWTAPLPAVAQTSASTALTAIFTEVTGDITLNLGGHTTRVSRGYVLRVVAAGDRIIAPEASKAALVCSNERFITVSAGAAVTLAEPVCAAGAALPAGTYHSLVPRGGRLRTVDGALVLERATRRETAPDVAILQSPRNTAVMEGRPRIEWTPSQGSVAYDVIVRGDVAWAVMLPSDRITCTPRKAPRKRSGTTCSASYPSSEPEVPPGGVVSLQIAPRSNDGHRPEIEPGMLWVRRLDEQESAAVEASAKTIQTIPDEATRSLLLANLYARHQLYAAAIPLYHKVAEVLGTGEVEAALGDAYLATGLLAEAETWYEAARRDPAVDVTAAGLYGLGHVYYARGEFWLAYERFEEAGRLFEGEGLKNHASAAFTAAADALDRIEE